MLVWRIVAMVLVAASALLSLGPVIALFQRYFADTRKSGYFAALLTGVLIFLPAAFILPRIENLSQMSWLTQYSRWKLALESLVFLAVLAIFVVRVHRQTRFKEYFFKGPYLYLIYLPLLIVEILHYRGTMYTLSAIYMILVALSLLSEWVSERVSHWLRYQFAPLVLSVFCLCVANAIQLFVLK